MAEELRGRNTIFYFYVSKTITEETTKRHQDRNIREVRALA